MLKLDNIRVAKEMIRILIDRGVDINSAKGTAGPFIANLAVQKEFNADIFSFLLKKGADLSILANNKRSLLFIILKVRQEPEIQEIARQWATQKGIEIPK